MTKEKKKQIISILGAIGVLVAVFYGGLMLGKSGPQKIEIVGIPDTTGKYQNVDFDTFWEAWDILRKDHLKGGEKNNQEFMYGAMAGLASSLEDPYTVFMAPEDSQKFQEDVGGNFGGVGMEIEVRDGQLLVVAPLDGTPAARAGMRAGDKILKIYDEDTIGIDVMTAVKKIRGEIGTEVKLMVARESWSEPREIGIIRGNIEIPTLEWEIKDGITYVKLMSFNNNSIPKFYEAVLKSLFSGSQGLVLDLRNNPGGYLEVATRLAGWFIEQGEVVVSEEFRSGEKTDFKANGNAVLKDFPVVVIVNKGSASASEILAGALRDVKGVKLVGEKTFGKGTVQELKILGDGSMMKVTTAHWVLPSGNIIDKEGLEPDVEVELTEEDIKADRDLQLEKAIEVIRELIK